MFGRKSPAQKELEARIKDLEGQLKFADMAKLEAHPSGALAKAAVIRRLLEAKEQLHHLKRKS